MNLAEILTADRVQLDVEATSKKRVLEAAAGLLAQTSASLSLRGVCDCLTARERLGSTGLGHGVALPHGRFAGLDDTIGAFLRIRQGVDFDAPDNQPVDLVFALLGPGESTEEHLQVLAQIAEFFGTEASREALRGDLSPRRACELLCSTDHSG